MAQWERFPLPMQEKWIESLDKEETLKKEMETHASYLP